MKFSKTVFATTLIISTISANAFANAPLSQLAQAELEKATQANMAEIMQVNASEQATKELDKLALRQTTTLLVAEANQQVNESVQGISLLN